jgi:hypothetical protein
MQPDDIEKIKAEKPDVYTAILKASCRANEWYRHLGKRCGKAIVDMNPDSSLEAISDEMVLWLAELSKDEASELFVDLAGFGVRVRNEDAKEPGGSDTVGMLFVAGFHEGLIEGNPEDPFVEFLRGEIAKV